MFKNKIALVHFVKYPQSGQVKTRLGKTIGLDEAAHVYGQLTRINHEVCLSVRDQFYYVVYYAPQERGAEIRNWLYDADDYWPQQGPENLTNRLSSCWLQAFANGFKGVIALGSDTTGLHEDILRKAYAALNTHEMVIGPSQDGGYYLIGSRQNNISVFNGIPWSTRGVFQLTMNIIKSQKIDCGILPMLNDLDEQLRPH